MNIISDYTRDFERSANITELRISAKIAEANWAGTDDKVYVSMGHHNNFQLFSDAPRVGEIISVDVDIPRLFGRPSIHISELQNISLHQIPIAHPIASDNWELDSLILIANGVFTNRSFKKFINGCMPLPRICSKFGLDISVGQTGATPTIAPSISTPKPIPCAGCPGSATSNLGEPTIPRPSKAQANWSAWSMES